MIVFKLKTASILWAPQREVNRVKKATFVALGDHWKTSMMAKHFTKEGAAEYGYTARKGEHQRGTKWFHRSYTGRKLRKMGHDLPLVFSGESRQRARLGSRTVATSKGCRVIIPAPALNFKHPKSRVNMRQEMTTVSNSELQILAGVGERVLAAEIKKLWEIKAETFR